MIAIASDILLPPPLSRVPRSAGLHQSEIIKAMAIDLGILDQEVVEDLGIADAQAAWWASLSPESRLRIAMGLAWEEWYIPQIPEVIDHPGELVRDGVAMSPDGESLDVIITQMAFKAIPIFEPIRRHVVRIHEVKATYKSVKTVGDLTSQWMWRSQIMGYCGARGTRYAALHVLFVDGDYTWPMRPSIRRWDIEFTQDEIDKDWELKMDYHKERMIHGR